VTSDPDFKVTTFCEVEYLKNYASSGQEAQLMLTNILMKTVPNIPNSTMFGDLD